jgi:hypothetical protein
MRAVDFGGVGRSIGVTGVTLDSVGLQSRGGLTPAPPLGEVLPAAEWTPRKYLFALVALGAPVGTVVAVGFLLGQPWIGAVAAALPIGVLILVKPEFGLYLFSFWYPFENFAEITPYVSLSKVLGIYTLLVVLIHAVRGRPGAGGPCTGARRSGLPWSLPCGPG